MSTKTPNVWTETIYEQSQEKVLIDGFPVALSAIFADLPTENE